MQRLGVKALAQQIDRLVTRAFPSVSVEGELAQVQVPQSGHAYLTLREQDAVLHCVMWRSEWNARREDPRVGERVVVTGRVGTFAGQGRYQVYVTTLERAGAGELQRRLEEIRARLHADGLLDPRRKRELPRYPRIVGVATSLKGAALQDFLRVSRDRWPAARILVSGCLVQGEEAPASVVRALELLFEDGRSEVIVVTRGGGSRLDLLPFDDEQLARWIATSPVPIVSAVGHEIDNTIADLVADRAAPTPTAAAVVVFPDRAAHAQRLDELVGAAERRVRAALAARRARVRELAGRLSHPARRVAERAERHRALVRRLEVAMARILERSGARARAASGRLDALSPFAVLERGYAVVQGPGGVVRSPGEVAPGDPLAIRVAGGGFEGVVAPPRGARDGPPRSG
jgi:exodeoxyribonuclease VII large subunit